jgi:hypothetical protein
MGVMAVANYLRELVPFIAGTYTYRSAERPYIGDMPT